MDVLVSNIKTDDLRFLCLFLFRFLCLSLLPIRREDAEDGDFYQIE